MGIYRKFQEAAEKRLVSSALSPSAGGIGATLTRKAIAGQLGMEIDLESIPKSDDIEREDYLLFSESQSRFIITIDPKKKEEFEQLFAQIPHSQIGKITENSDFIIKNGDKTLIKTDIQTLTENYKKTFKDY